MSFLTVPLHFLSADAHAGCASKSVTGHRATGIVVFSVRWGLMSEKAPDYRRELCRWCHCSPWTTDIVFDILGPTWRLLWKANLLPTGHLFPQALECRSSGCLQTLAAGQSSPRWTVKVKTLYRVLTRQEPWTSLHPPTCGWTCPNRMKHKPQHQ